METNKQPKVIIWCLTYNQKDYIRDALNGFVMQQTDFSFEVVVHDDASTDGTTDIVMDYARRYPDIIKPMIEKENQWQVGGLKHIINIMNERHRCGKYIAFCEGDDYWTDSNKLQRQVDFLDNNPDYSMCFHSAKKKYETDAHAWIDCENIQDKDYDATDIFINWTVPTASILCRKEAMDFYANLKHPELIQNYDIFIILSCAMVGKIRGMHDQMSVYRIQGEGLTYNKEALVRCKMNNPGHFMTLKENFPIVDAKPVDDTISKVFFERAMIQDSFGDKFKDYLFSFRFHPKRFVRMMFQKLLRRFHHLILYGIIGLFSSGLDFSIYSLLVWGLGFQYILANCISVLGGISTSFALNRNYNFKVKDKVKLRFAIFLITGVSGLMLSNIILYVCISEIGMDKIVSKLLSIVLVVFFQFLINKNITFRFK